MGIRDWLRGARSADGQAVEAEIEFHLDRATAENLAEGMPPAEARAEAIRRFGDLEKVRLDCLAVRGRGVSPLIVWTAVAALAGVSFLSGYAMRTGTGSPAIQVALPTARGRVSSTAVLFPDGVRFQGVLMVNGVGSDNRMCTFRTTGHSPFSAWSWRDAVPEVTLDGKTWHELVSAGGVPAATMRDGYIRSRGQPAWNLDPYEMILRSGPRGGHSVEVVLRSLADGAEARVDCPLQVSEPHPATEAPK